MKRWNTKDTLIRDQCKDKRENNKDAKLKCNLKAQQRLKTEREDMRVKNHFLNKEKHFLATAISQWYGKETGHFFNFRTGFLIKSQFFFLFNK